MFLAAFASWTSLHAESITGVLYFNEVNNGAHRANYVELDTGKQVITIGYTEPLERRFRDKSCSEIGAVWTMTVQHPDGGLFATRAICRGLNSETVNSAWKAVRDYLDGLPSYAATSALISTRLRYSPEFRELLALMNSGDLSFPSSQGKPSGCLRVVSVKESSEVRIVTTCGVRLRGKAADLHFEVPLIEGKRLIDGLEIK